MSYLEKEYSLENIRFWLAVNEFKRASDSEILQKSKQIFEWVPIKYFEPLTTFFWVHSDIQLNNGVSKQSQVPS